MTSSQIAQETAFIFPQFIVIVPVTLVPRRRGSTFMKSALMRCVVARRRIASASLFVSALHAIPVTVHAQAPALATQSVATPTVHAAAPTPSVIARTDGVVAGDATRTRFVIGLERAVEFQVFSLANPNRVIVELPEVKLQLPAFAGDAPVGLVKSFRGGMSAPGKTRVVIDVSGAVVVEKASLDKGKDGKSPRLVLEIVPVDGTAKPTQGRKYLSTAVLAGLGASGVQPPLPKPAQRPGALSATMFKPTIVIDPGHGGHDSGAQKFGTIEKDVVLAFSLKLRDKLQSTGRYKVLMTRDNDSFIELDARREFADKSKAALFIAVHADYAGSSARGATIYSLRDSVANDLQRSAKGEVVDTVLSSKELQAVKLADGDVGAVKGILADLAQREVAVNKERTKVFAGSVVEYMGGSTNMMNNPDREAGFRVLKSAKMPSVLIELAYVSNRSDAENLKSDSWRDKVTGSIVTAVENYFSHQMARLPM
jgi:N-acetylmuramoyl-L-alanine amidase